MRSLPRAFRTDAQTSAVKPTGTFATTLSRLWRNPTASFGAALLVLLAGSAVLAPLLALHDPLALVPAERLRAPSHAHLFGTDMLGRDLYARVLHGGRLSLTVGILTAVICSLIGLAIGLVAGFSRLADALIMRVMDGIMAIPGILLAIALATIVGGGVSTIVLAIAVPEIPVVVRVVRGVVLTLREQTYVEAARSLGTRPGRILIRHILPNSLAPLVVQATYICGLAILIEAYLSFLGAGIPPEFPSWGNIMAEGRGFVLIAEWIILIPGAFVAATVLALNLLGDALRDMLDPRTRRTL
ncbi:MAG: ABC transporter permease [Azospirillaceae bacterium]